MNHLTDDQIQAYLDKDNTVNLNEIAFHIKNCVQCKSNYDVYQSLYKMLKYKKIPVFSKNFISLTMKKLENKNDKKWTMFENIVVTVMSVVGLVIGLYVLQTFGIGSYFINIDFGFMTEFVKSTIMPVLPYLITAIIIVSIAEVLDKLRFHKLPKYSR